MSTSVVGSPRSERLPHDGVVELGAGHPQRDVRVDQVEAGPDASRLGFEQLERGAHALLLQACPRFIRGCRGALALLRRHHVLASLIQGTVSAHHLDAQAFLHAAPALFELHDLRADRVGLSARHADVLVLQGQEFQSNRGAYRREVNAAARRARHMNHGVRVVSQIGASPNRVTPGKGGPAGKAALKRSAADVAGKGAPHTDGFMLWMGDSSDAVHKNGERLTNMIAARKHRKR